jgi:SSS family solute:Na+ symporter
MPLALFLESTPTSLISLSPVDIAVIAIYFMMVIGIGFYLKRFTQTGEDFFLAGREMTAWIAGLSFVAANLGSLEMMGWAAAAYQYGILATHWYWIGAIPAMLFLGIIMMPFYYISKTHSVPGYLKLRFGEPARALSAISFGLMTVLMSGVNMYAMALVLKVILGWDINFSIWVSSLTVAAYVFLGGLRSAIFNEVLQFFLIWLGGIVVSIVGLIEAGGWSGMVARIHERWPGQDYTHMWNGLGNFSDNPMGIHWTGIVLGLGFVISFGYWTTDFLVVQRVLTARDMRSAKMAPIIGAAFKMAVPFIVILPGLLALAVLPEHLVGEAEATATQHSYNEVLPIMMARYCGPGLLGLGITALIAGFMSGMAGNVSAFTTVWTYDIYRSLIKKDGTDHHYLNVGRWTTVLGVLVSIGTAYLVMSASSIMDYVQSLFSFFIAPLFATVIFGMLWKRTTRLLGLAMWDGRFHRYVDLGQDRSFGAQHHRAVTARQDHGPEHVSGAVGLDHLRGGHNRCQLTDQAQAGVATGGLGLWLHGTALGRSPQALSASHLLGGGCGFGPGCGKYYLLVGTKYD